MSGRRRSVSTAGNAGGFEGYAPLGDVRLWYRDTGGTGPALVLCHPGSQSCAVWEHQIEPFARAGYRVIAYSRRGHFRSQAGDSSRPGTMVGDLRSLLDYLGIETVLLLGAAAGGIAALGFAVTWPQRVRCLILALPDRVNKTEIVSKRTSHSWFTLIM